MKLTILRIEEGIIVIAGLQFWCKMVQTGGDKKCMFTAISYLVNDGDVTKVNEVRAEIVNFVINNWWMINFFNDEQYCVEGLTLSKRRYAQEMSKPHIKGTICEIMAAAALYPYQFVLVQEKKVKVIVGQKGHDIKILSLDGDYFNVLIPFAEKNPGNVQLQ